MNKNAEIVISVNKSKIRIIKINNEDYISLTDLAQHKNKNNPSDVIKKWLSNYDTIEFLGLWEELSNKDFNLAEFSQIKIESPKKSFTMSPSQWCKRVKAIGITCSQGKYSIGTFAHSDIAFEFASWIDNLFKLYLIKEFQRLKKRKINQNKNDEEKFVRKERLVRLNSVAKSQIELIKSNLSFEKLKQIENKKHNFTE